MKREGLFLTILLTVVFLSCNDFEKSNDVSESEALPSIFPDYAEVTIPPNIAPLNFLVREPGQRYQVRITGMPGISITIRSKNGVIIIPRKRWGKLLDANVGNYLTYETFVFEEGKWTKFKPFRVLVSADEMDGYLAYRLINVGYILWKKMGLYQRDLGSFRETPIMVNRNTDGNCMNCHSFSRGDPGRMMFHMRAKHAGTMFITKDSIYKINTKTPYTMSAAVYPSWHPDGKHVAYSVDIVNQWFHGIDKRNEVYDKASDLIVYNMETNTVTTHPGVASHNRETLPCWSADGTCLYYCTTAPMNDSIGWLQVQYDLMRVHYDVETGEWGHPEPVLLAKEVGGSITFPKTSPDGRFLIFTRGSHGYFTIYNPTSDLYILDLESCEYRPFPYNSNDVDSYHSWSQNSRWVVFSSKRIDGLCTRPFFFHIDEAGNSTKPFVMPQSDPRFYNHFKSNYNVPELITGAVRTNRLELLKKARGKANNVLFDQNVDVNGLSGATKIEPSLLH